MGGLEKLGINVPLLITQLISFLILLAALYFLLYKKILKMLDDRAQRVKESMEQADSVKNQSARAEEEVKKQLQIASQRGQELIAQATQTSDEIRAKAQDLAKQDTEVLIEKARQAIKTERDSAVDELRQEFAELTILAASKVVGESLDKASHKKLIDKVLAENQTLNKG
jgi:F-type H+-transporting ATPase subunit b